ncbi:hypothetical protein PQX77_000627 [Marasmius sp. AFHP31]|nr:hypothetical protein PQX77_000627 [Marasmius sp. AFHP31]
MNLDTIHHESLQQLLNQVRPRSKLTLIPDFPLFPGNVVEIQGASGCGKTHLIYAAIMNCILPAIAGGWFKAAVLFDSDNSFDLNRFKSLLVSRLGHLSHTNPTSEVTQTLADRSLELLHIFRPTSSNQLASSILHLPSYHSAHLSHHEIGAIAIDSLSAFYWPDRFTVEQLRSHSGDNTEKDAPNPLRRILIALERLRVLYNPLILCSNWGLTFAQLYAPCSPSEVRYYKQHLHPSPSPFTNEGETLAHNDKGTLSVTHHITLNVVPALQTRKKSDPCNVTEDGSQLESIQQHVAVGAVRIPGGSRAVSFDFTIEPDILTFGAREQSEGSSGQ